MKLDESMLPPLPFEENAITSMYFRSEVRAHAIDCLRAGALAALDEAAKKFDDEPWVLIPRADAAIRLRRLRDTIAKGES